MARRSLWQEIRDWLWPSARDLEASSAETSSSIAAALAPGVSHAPEQPDERVLRALPPGQDPSFSASFSASPVGSASSRTGDALPDSTLSDNTLPDNTLPDSTLSDNTLPDNVVPFVRPGRATFDGADGFDDFQGVAALGADGAAVLDDGFPDSELLDFMAADVDPVPADPAFRDRLREQLWEMVVEEGVAAPAAVKRSVDPDERGPGSS